AQSSTSLEGAAPQAERYPRSPGRPLGWPARPARGKGPGMSDTPKPPEIQLQIQLDDDVANGQYINLALGNHTETEFTLDFIYMQPQQPKARVRSRIITNPRHMKRLLMAMQENLAKYEARFGPVEPSEPRNPIH